MTAATRAAVRMLAAAGALLALAACGGPADAPEPPSGITTSTAAGGAPTAAPTAPPDPVYGAWAERFCAATAAFDTAVAAVQDPVDPRALPLDERVARGQRRFSAYVAALADTRDALQTLAPAPGAEPYQRVTQAQVDELARLFAAAVDALAAAGSGAAIDRIVADLQVEVERLENSLDVAAQTLPLPAGRAILAAARCGDLLG